MVVIMTSWKYSYQQNHPAIFDVAAGCLDMWKTAARLWRMVEVIVAHLNREKCRREDQNKDPGG